MEVLSPSTHLRAYHYDTPFYFEKQGGRQMEDRWKCDVDDKLEDHEGRIRKVENSSAVLETKLNMMIAILSAIAIMVGGGLVKLIF